MFYPIEVAGTKRNLQLYPVSDSLSIAAFILLGDVELTENCARELLTKAPEFDYMLTAEAKSISLVQEMGRLAGVRRFFVARKGLKVYMREPLCVEVKSITTAKVQHLYLTEEEAAMMKGKRILIVDDVISTGKSLEALEALVEQAGGTVCGRMAVLAEGDAMKRKDITFLEPLPLFTPDGKPLAE